MFVTPGEKAKPRGELPAVVEVYNTFMYRKRRLRFLGVGESCWPGSGGAGVLTAVGLSIVLLMPALLGAAQDLHGKLWSGSGCTASSCHQGIEPILQPSSGMFREIRGDGRKLGDADGCVICHGGNPKAVTKSAAHHGAIASLAKKGGPDAFYPDPASPWVNNRTCAQCHPKLVRAQWNSLMMTEAGKIQGATWAFGSLEGYQHRWSNYDGKNPARPADRLGTPAYRAYMARKAKAFPNVYVERQKTLPEAPRGEALKKLADHPGQAVFTYLRTECERCHLGVKGRARRGDYRGMGCGACHMPYSNEGFYEGADQTIPHDKPGYPLVHSIQATRSAPVQTPRIRYTGIPVETCTTCHNRGKRIGVSYQGLMESAWASPYTEGGGGQIALHTKHYIALSKDVHYREGMLCQDCHTSIDVHGDGFIGGTDLAQVEIECADCHGTPSRYPWELPLGYGDENGPGAATGPPRGVAKEVPKYLRKGKVYPVRDGYLLTARGNPMPEVVRVGDRVLLHTAGGKDLWIDPLKKKAAEGDLSLAAQVAMVRIQPHIQNMECYSCHASWAPQCYGCHVKVDYSNGARSFDWTAAGHEHMKPGRRTVRGEQGFGTTVPGKITEMRSYMRWEDPMLGINGEGRVSPLIPGCQVSVTIIGPRGKTIVLNHIFRTLPGSEGGGKQGQLSLDMAPVQPHTIGESRNCESCHASAKAMGYGIGGSHFNQPWDTPKIVDLTTANGFVIPGKARVQIEPIKGLGHDWSAVVTPGGKQLMTVGHHFKGSGPLSGRIRKLMDRRNVCLGCHREIPRKSLAVSLLHHVAEVSGMIPVSRKQHEENLHKILLIAAWVQVVAGVAVFAGLLFLLLWWFRRRRLR